MGLRCSLPSVCALISPLLQCQYKAHRHSGLAAAACRKACFCKGVQAGGMSHVAAAPPPSQPVGCHAAADCRAAAPSQKAARHNVQLPHSWHKSAW